MVMAPVAAQTTGEMLIDSVTRVLCSIRCAAYADQYALLSVSYES